MDEGRQKEEEDECELESYRTNFPFGLGNVGGALRNWQHQ